MRCSRVITILPVVCVGVFCQLAFAGSETTPEEAFKPTAVHEQAAPFAETAVQTLDSAPLNRILQKHLYDGRMDFAALKKDTAARKDLEVFLAAIASMPEGEPLASWINTYNALVIDAVVQRYPLASVTDVPDFFSKIMYKVAGKERSMDDVENGVIRPRFKDARIHVALNCGAVSCPKLPAVAFEQATLQQDLDALAREVVNDGHHIVLNDGKLEVSALFIWFKDDFIRDGGSLAGWFRKYADADPLKTIPDDVPLVEQPYDWKLGAHIESRTD